MRLCDLFPASLHSPWPPCCSGNASDSAPPQGPVTRCSLCLETHSFTCSAPVLCLSGRSLDVTTSEWPFPSFCLKESPSTPNPISVLFIHLTTSFSDSGLSTEDTAVSRVRPCPWALVGSIDKVEGWELILIEDTHAHKCS